jgi:hypothetical protein
LQVTVGEKAERDAVAVTLWNFIREVLKTNLGQITDYFHRFFVMFSVPPCRY